MNTKTISQQQTEIANIITRIILKKEGLMKCIFISEEWHLEFNKLYEGYCIDDLKKMSL